MGKTALAGLTQAELGGLFPELPPFRARQIAASVAAGASSFDQITSLPLSLRAALAERCTLRSLRVTKRLPGRDGTVKLRLEPAESEEAPLAVEAVLLRDGKGRPTACLSTQAGCGAGCVFCKTGALGLARNLSAAEIVEQFFYLREALTPEEGGPLSLPSQDAPLSPPAKAPPTRSRRAERQGQAAPNIVLMGMGEPLANLAAVRKALDILCSGVGLSRRRITLSTSGLISGIRALTSDGPDVRLAVSLTTAREELRRRLMPLSAANPLTALKEALLDYQARRQRRLTLEAVLLGGLNTSEADARSLADFARGLDVVVNLIPWNRVEGLTLDGQALTEPTAAEAARFEAALVRRGLKVVRRREKGRDIQGACGQLGDTGHGIP